MITDELRADRLIARLGAGVCLIAAIASCSAKVNPANDGRLDSVPADVGNDIADAVHDLTPTDGPQLDSDAADDAVPDAPSSAPTIGAPCVVVEDGADQGCTPGVTQCLKLFADGRGFCSHPCEPDNPNTSDVNEDDCPNGSACATGLAPSGSWCAKVCIPKLNASREERCPAQYMTCNPLSILVLPSSILRAVCTDGGCRNDFNCPLVSRFSCTAIEANEKECQDKLGTEEARCLESNKETHAGVCIRAGRCELSSGLCAPHPFGNESAKVGDPCKSDMDCPGRGFCLRETVDAQGRTQYRNGYCSITGCAFADTLTESRCPEGSTCLLAVSGGFCYKLCDPEDADSCRGLAGDRRGDYECYDLTFATTRGGRRSADAPVCFPPFILPCDKHGDALGCAGLPGNYQCVNPQTFAELPSVRDPNGVCLDQTHSGP